VVAFVLNNINNNDCQTANPRMQTLATTFNGQFERCRLRVSDHDLLGLHPEHDANRSQRLSHLQTTSTSLLAATSDGVGGVVPRALGCAAASAH
jgi:hypothetical protein